MIKKTAALGEIFPLLWQVVALWWHPMCLHATLWAYSSRQLEVGEVTWNPFYFYPRENARARILEQLETDGVTALHPLTNICHQCGRSAKGCSESKVMGDWSLVKFRSYSQGLISLQMLPERRWGTENRFFICYWVESLIISRVSNSGVVMWVVELLAYKNLALG